MLIHTGTRLSAGRWPVVLDADRCDDGCLILPVHVKTGHMRDVRREDIMMQDPSSGKPDDHARPVIVIAIDSFKGCISSLDAAAELAAGLRQEEPDVEVRILPVADGGEGTVEAIAHGIGGTWVSCQVHGPLGDLVEAKYLVTGNGTGTDIGTGSDTHSDTHSDTCTAILELAAASGLTLIPPEERDPLRTNTYGTGEMIRHALEHGCRHLYLGVGGSATNDGGVGLVEALGVRFFDEDDRPVMFGANPAEWIGGAGVERIARIDLSQLEPAVGAMTLTVACDVDNPLCGPHGASAVFGPQKGATTVVVERLDAALARYAAIVAQQTSMEIARMPGAGAAGGVNASLIPFCGARLKPGIQWVLEAVGLQRRLDGAHLVITGEGRMDGQSIHGKAPVGVAALAKEVGIPVVAVVGDVGPGIEAVYGHGIDRVLKLRRENMSLEESIASVRIRLRDAGARIARECLRGRISPDQNGPQEA